MAINQNDLDNILNAAADKTDQALAAKIQEKTTLSEADISAICPAKGDTAKLAELIDIVKSGENENNKINNIFSNAEKFGKIVVTLVSKFI